MTVVPIGVVSKAYTLVPHTLVLDLASQALSAAKINLEDAKAELRITEYGERMALSLFLPDKYQFDPGDGHSMTMRLECQNSVDGSSRFRALMGWFRFVCSNGLVVGITSSHIRRRHIGDLQVDDIAEVLTTGIQRAGIDRENFVKWRNTSVNREQLARWSETILRKAWGFKAAARAYYIACTGTDAEVNGTYKDNSPTTIAVKPTRKVPGAPSESRNLYDVSQILAWLAKERRDLQEQVSWRDGIPGLMARLKK